MSARRGWWAPLAALAAGAAVAVAGATADGGRGALSAALGTVLVLVFLAAGLVPLVLGTVAGAGVGAAVLLLNYTLRLALAVAVLRLASEWDAVEPRWTTYAVVAAALSWALAQAVAVLLPARGAGSDEDHDRAGHGPAGAAR